MRLVRLRLVHLPTHFAKGAGPVICEKITEKTTGDITPVLSGLFSLVRLTHAWLGYFRNTPG